MKKAIALIASIMVVLSSVAVFPLGMAEPVTTVFVNPHETNVEVGQTFSVDISIANVTGLLGFDFLLSYSITILQLANIQEGPFLKSVDSTLMINLTTEGLVWLAVTLYSTQGQLKSANGSGVLAIATFKAIAVGQSSLGLFSKDPFKPDEVKLATDPPPDDVIPIPNVAIDGLVVVSPDPPSTLSDPPPDPPPDPTPDPAPVAIIGDVNGDRIVDMKDVGYVAVRFETHPAELLWDAKADVNGDGTVNMKDIGIVARNFGTSGT